MGQGERLKNHENNNHIPYITISAGISLSRIHFTLNRILEVRKDDAHIDRRPKTGKSKKRQGIAC